MRRSKTCLRRFIDASEMEKTMTKLNRSVLITLLGVVTIVSLVSQTGAQTPAGFSRKQLQQADLSIPGKECVMAIGEFQPGVAIGRHTHPGEEITYLLEGTILLQIEGKPDRTV